MPLKCCGSFTGNKEGKQICLPNFGMEILHHVHGYDVAQVFFNAITHRSQSLGESFDAEAVPSALKRRNVCWSTDLNFLTLKPLT